MTMLALACIFSPDVQAVTVLNAINETTSVLRAVSVDLVAITSFLVHLPITAVTALLLSIDLNTVAINKSTVKVLYGAYTLVINHLDNKNL